MIHITVNNTSYQCKEKSFLEEVLTHANISENGIAIAVNQEVISKKDWKTFQLNDNDSILIIKATQGG